MGENFGFTYPGGYRLTIDETILNAGGAGTQQLQVEPATGGELHVILAGIRNQDTVSRTATMEYADSLAAAVLPVLSQADLDAAARAIWGDEANSTAGLKLQLVSGGFPIASDYMFLSQLVDVADGQDSRHVVIVNVFGGDPTVTEVGT